MSRWELERWQGPGRCADRILRQKGPTSGLEQTARSPWTLESIARRSGPNSTLSEGGGLLAGPWRLLALRASVSVCDELSIQNSFYFLPGLSTTVDPPWLTGSQSGAPNQQLCAVWKLTSDAHLCLVNWKVGEGSSTVSQVTLVHSPVGEPLQYLEERGKVQQTRTACPLFSSHFICCPVETVQCHWEIGVSSVQWLM